MLAHSFCNPANLEIFEYEDGSMRGVRARILIQMKQFVCKYKATFFLEKESMN